MSAEQDPSVNGNVDVSGDASSSPGVVAAGGLEEIRRNIGARVNGLVRDMNCKKHK